VRPVNSDDDDDDDHISPKLKSITFVLLMTPSDVRMNDDVMMCLVLNSQWRW